MTDTYEILFAKAGYDPSTGAFGLGGRVPVKRHLLVYHGHAALFKHEVKSGYPVELARTRSTYGVSGERPLAT